MQGPGRRRRETGDGAGTRPPGRPAGAAVAALALALGSAPPSAAAQSDDATGTPREDGLAPPSETDPSSAPKYPGHEDTDARSNVLGGHRFLLSEAFETGFTTGYVVAEVGAGLGRQEVLDPGPLADLIGEDDFSLMNVALGVAGQAQLADWIALRLRFDAFAFIGTGFLAAVNSGVTAKMDVAGGAVLGWEVGDWRIGLTTDLGYGYDLGVLPVLLLDQGDEGAFPPSVTIHSLSSTTNLTASWGVTPWLGLSARVLFGYASLWRIDEYWNEDRTEIIRERPTTDSVVAGGGVLLDLDLFPATGAPIAFLLGYTPFYSTLFETTTHELVAGVYYTEYDFFQLGLDTRSAINRTSAVTPERRNTLFVAAISVRFLWN